MTVMFTAENPQREPFVSVIMPIRNEAVWIRRSLTAVLQQDYPPDRLEIIAADGLSEDATVEIIDAVANDPRVTVVQNPQRTQAAGLNRALEHARGDIIIRVDGHTVIATDYVRRCVELLRETGAQTVGGRIHPVGITPMGKGIAAALQSRFAVPSLFRTGNKPQPADTVYMGAWNRSILDHVGRFDERFIGNEDYELNARIRAAGGVVYFSPALCSDYYGPQTLRSLYRQYFRYGGWKPLTIAKHPRSLRLRQLAAPMLVSYLLFGVLAVIALPALWNIWFAGILLYLMLCFNAAYRVSRKHGVPILMLPLVFWTVHLAWGLGFWLGGIRFLAHQFERLGRGQRANPS